jgi:ribose transport system permease protein
MTALSEERSVRDVGREAPLIFLIAIMAILYAAGLYLNPAFFGSTDALFSGLRDASRYGVLAIGMTFVIVNKELDLSVSSTFGLTAAIFGMIFAPTYFDLSVGTAIFWCLVIGLAIGLMNGFLVTVLEVPAFIATLTMLFIGRGVILGLTGGKNIAFEIKAGTYPAFFRLGEINAFGFNNQIILFLIFAAVGAVARAYTSIGWTIDSVGGNEQAARYAGINTRLVRMRSYALSSLCAVTAGLMSVAQNKDADPLAGFGLELIAISSVIVGGAAIFGGRGRILGSCLGAILIGLIDKVLREGVPTTRTIDLGGGETAQVAAVTQLPPGAVPAFLGVVLIIAALIEPRLVRRRAIPRLWAWLRGRPPPPVPDLGGIAVSGVQTRGANVQARGLGKRGIAAFFYRRDAAAVILMVALWLFGWWARPDFWAGLDNSFATLLAFFRDRSPRCRPHFCHGQRGHRPFGRLSAGAVRRSCRRHHEGHRLGPARRGWRRNPGRRHRRPHQRLAHRLRRLARLYRHSRDILLGARGRLLDCLRHTAQRFSRIVQSHRTKPLRAS